MSAGKGAQHEVVFLNKHHLKGGKEEVINFSLFEDLASVGAFIFPIL